MWALVATAMALEPVIEPVGEGKINWTTMELLASATGRAQSGAMLNLETLEDDARSQLGPLMLTLAREVRVDAQARVGDLLAKGDDLADRVDDNLSLWEVYETRYYTSGSVEIDGSLPLLGLLRPALVRGADGSERDSPPTGSTTGLLVDARGLDVRPAMCPRLLAPDGSVLYALAVVTETSASARTPVVYVRDPADIAAARRAGPQPVLVSAEAVVEGADLQLSAADAAIIREKAAAAPFLIHGNVVIVVGPAAGVVAEPKP